MSIEFWNCWYGEPSEIPFFCIGLSYDDPKHDPNILFTFGFLGAGFNLRIG